MSAKQVLIFFLGVFAALGVLWLVFPADGIAAGPLTIRYSSYQRSLADAKMARVNVDSVLRTLDSRFVMEQDTLAFYRKLFFENPDRISARVLEAGLDSQTGFEIVSIDIADISVAGVSDVANVGARLETERANADKQLRQAEAEGRRAMAVAIEQEMKARVQEMQSRVVEARAEVPKAMAQALREGKLGVMDYYRLQNIESDTDMRRAIAGPSAAPTDGADK